MKATVPGYANLIFRLINCPYHAPLNVPFFGRTIPLTAVFGGLGTFAVWLIVTLTYPLVWYIGIPWMIFGLILYLYYRHRLGLSLTKTVVAPRRANTSAGGGAA